MIYVALLIGLVGGAAAVAVIWFVEHKKKEYTMNLKRLSKDDLLEVATHIMDKDRWRSEHITALSGDIEETSSALDKLADLFEDRLWYSETTDDEGNEVTTKIAGEHISSVLVDVSAVLKKILAVTTDRIEDLDNESEDSEELMEYVDLTEGGDDAEN